MPDAVNTNSLEYKYANPGPGSVAAGSNAVGQTTESDHFGNNPAFAVASELAHDPGGRQFADAPDPGQPEVYGAADLSNPLVGGMSRDQETVPTDHSAQIPNTPVITSAVAGAAGHATVTWTEAPDADGYALTGYTVTATSVTGGAATPVTATVAGNVLTADVAGLTSAATYTFTVHATNQAGNSPESAASAGVVVA